MAPDLRPRSTDMAASSRRVGLCLLAVLVFSGCTPIAENITRESTPIAVEQSLRAANDPPNKKRINELLKLRGLVDTGRLFARGAAQGMTMYLSSVLGNDDVAAAGERYLDQMANDLASRIRDEFAPALRAWIVGTTRTAMAEGVFSPPVRQQARRFAAATSRASTQAILEVLTDRLETDLGPALEHLIVRHVGQGIATAIREHVIPTLAEALREAEVRTSLGEAARTIGKNAVIGMLQGLEEMERRTPEDIGPFEALQRAFTSGEESLDQVMWMLGLAVLLLVLLLIPLGVWLYRTARHVERLAEKDEAREQTLTEIVKAVEQVDPSDAAPSPEDTDE